MKNMGLSKLKIVKLLYENNNINTTSPYNQELWNTLKSAVSYMLEALTLCKSVKKNDKQQE